MYEYKAKVIRWLDGDTLEVSIDLGFYVHKEEKIRLARINAPEMRDEVPYHARKAKSARFQARKFCPEGAEITIQTTKAGRDRYARYIAEVIHKKENLSDYLVKIGAARVLEE